MFNHMANQACDLFIFASLDIVYVYVVLFTNQHRGGSRISHWGTTFRGGRGDLQCGRFLAKEEVKMKELGPVGGVRRKFLYVGRTTGNHTVTKTAHLPNPSQNGHTDPNNSLGIREHTTGQIFCVHPVV